MPVKIAGSEELCGLIAYKDIITNETIRQQVPMSIVQSEQIDAIKIVRACVMDSQQTSSTGRPKKRWMDCIEEDQGPMTIGCNKVWKNSRKTMNDTERHCCRHNMEEPNSGING